MAGREKTQSMIFAKLFAVNQLSTNFKRILWYYLGYSLLVFVLHLASISFVAFFHFLLEHDISVLEAWLHDNAWEILGFSKLIAFLLFFKIIHLNLENVIMPRELWRQLKFIPNIKGASVILFFTALFPALLRVFDISLIPVKNWSFTNFQFASLVGNMLFFLLDFILVVILIANLKLRGKQNRLLLFAVISVLFYAFSSLIISYPNHQIFLFIHLFTMLILFHRGLRNIGNAILYAFACIAGFAILYGVDPVWGNQYSLYPITSYPIFSIFILWLMGIVYYLRR